jgi:hypothetical protein
MARQQQIDRSGAARLDEFEQRLFQLKIIYEKYFCGIEKLVPTREHDEIRRILRDLVATTWTNTAQAYRLQALKARFTTMELYFSRNLFLIERGLHPAFKFRADLAQKAQESPRPASPSGAELQAEKEERTFKSVFDRYLEARKACNLSANVDYSVFRDALKTQVDKIRTEPSCRSVRFRIVVEGRKVKLKVVPIRTSPADAPETPST